MEDASADYLDRLVIWLEEDPENRAIAVRFVATDERYLARSSDELMKVARRAILLEEDAVVNAVVRTRTGGEETWEP